MAYPRVDFTYNFKSLDDTVIQNPPEGDMHY